MCCWPVVICGLLYTQCSHIYLKGGQNHRKASIAKLTVRSWKTALLCHSPSGGLEEVKLRKSVLCANRGFNAFLIVYTEVVIA